MRTAKKERDEAMREADLLRDFIRETGQVNAFLEWAAKRLGLHEALYPTPTTSNRTEGEGFQRETE